MAVVRISPNDSPETKKQKERETEEAKRSLEATREAIRREFGGPNPGN